MQPVRKVIAIGKLRLRMRVGLAAWRIFCCNIRFWVLLALAVAAKLEAFFLTISMNVLLSGWKL
jgi:hypothetical protein